MLCWLAYFASVLLVTYLPAIFACLFCLLQETWLLHLLAYLQEPVKLQKGHKDGNIGHVYVLTYKKTRLRGKQQMKGILYLHYCICIVLFDLH